MSEQVTNNLSEQVTYNMDGGAVVACALNNRKVPGSIPSSEPEQQSMSASSNSDSNQQLPSLRYLDQTPIGKQDSKRKHCELSPIQEQGELMNLMKRDITINLSDGIIIFQLGLSKTGQRTGELENVVIYDEF